MRASARSIRLLDRASHCHTSTPALGVSPRRLLRRRLCVKRACARVWRQWQSGAGRALQWRPRGACSSAHTLRATAGSLADATEGPRRNQRSNLRLCLHGITGLATNIAEQCAPRRQAACTCRLLGCIQAQLVRAATWLWQQPMDISAETRMLCAPAPGACRSCDKHMRTHKI